MTAQTAATNAPRLPVFIHGFIDDLKLSLEAFRVYCHLARRFGKKGAIGSYKAIAEHCFRESYPTATIATLRRKAIAAVKELEENGLIEKELNQRQDGGNACNTYDLASLESLQEGVLTPGGVHRHKVVPIHQGVSTHQGVRSHQHKEVTPYEVSPLEVSPLEVTPLFIPQGEPEEKRAREEPIEVEIVQEESGSQEPMAGNQRPKTESSTQQQTPGVDKNSAAPPNLEELYDSGQVKELPPLELRKLAIEQLGTEFFFQYRKSGRIQASSPNDIDRSFKTYLMQRDKQPEISYATRLISKLERTPSRWGELVDLIQDWNLHKEGKTPQIKQAMRSASVEGDLQARKDKNRAALSF